MGNIGVHVAEAAACTLFAASIATDVHRRQVPNAVPLLLLGLFALYAAAGAVRPIADLWQHFAVGAAVLAAGFALYLTGRFGAGDAKLLAAAGIWIGPALSDLSLFTVQHGGVRAGAQHGRPAALREDAADAHGAALRRRDRATRNDRARHASAVGRHMIPENR